MQAADLVGHGRGGTLFWSNQLCATSVAQAQIREVSLISLKAVE